MSERVTSRIAPASAEKRSSRNIGARIADATTGGTIFPLWVRREHPSYSRMRRQLEQSQYWTAEQLAELQRNRLQRLLEHAVAACPFYRDRIRSAGLDVSRMTAEQFTSLPRLTKREIQDHQAELVARDFPEGSRVRNQTGGSTGSPLQFYVDRERFGTRMASTHRHDAWAGIRPGQWLAYVWGARLDQLPQEGIWNRLRNSLLYRRIDLNTSCIADTDWMRFIDECRRKNPRHMIAYAQSAVLFAKYVRENAVSGISFDSIITTAEVLLPEQRKLIEEVFCAEVFDRYGCREVSIIASECEQHKGLHVNAEALLVEVVPDAALPKQIGKILVTDLLNYSMPLIRYEIGDAASWLPEQKCACGRGLPLLSQVQGRTTDFLSFRDRRVSGPALTLVIADMKEIRQAQFVQTGDASVILRVVPGNSYSADTVKELRSRMLRYLGADVALSVEETQSIQSEASGKFRFVIHDVPAGQKQ